MAKLRSSGPADSDSGNASQSRPEPLARALKTTHRVVKPNATNRSGSHSSTSQGLGDQTAPRTSRKKTKEDFASHWEVRPLRVLKNQACSPHYLGNFEPSFNTNLEIRLFQDRRRWYPANPHNLAFPSHKKLAYVKRLYLAMTNFQGVWPWVGLFSNGRYTREQIYYICLLIWEAAHELHVLGVAFSDGADPTAAGINKNKFDNIQERNLAPEIRLGKVIILLHFCKKACEDAMGASSVMKLLEKFLAAPDTAYATRTKDLDVNDNKAIAALKFKQTKTEKKLRKQALAATLNQLNAMHKVFAYPTDNEIKELNEQFPNFDYNATTYTALQLPQAIVDNARFVELADAMDAMSPASDPSTAVDTATLSVSQHAQLGLSSAPLPDANGGHAFLPMSGRMPPTIPQDSAPESTSAHSGHTDNSMLELQHDYAAMQYNEHVNTGVRYNKWGFSIPAPANGYPYSGELDPRLSFPYSG